MEKSAEEQMQVRENAGIDAAHGGEINLRPLREKRCKKLCRSKGDTGRHLCGSETVTCEDSVRR